jgi:flagellar hook-basal body complex protein FliE
VNPSAVSGLTGLKLPVLPSISSGALGAGAGSFGSMYDAMVQGSGPQDPERLKLPTRMEVAPLWETQPGMAPMREQDALGSREFPGAAAPSAGASSSETPRHLLTPFSDALKQVNALSADAERMGRLAAVGGDVDLHDVMIASEKASVAMSLTLQVRNKMVEAYQEVMRLQV